MLIPKVINYVWFGGGEKPELVKNCMASWKKYLPDYEIVEWNENNFDLNTNRFCKEAVENKKWAFAADYARCWILYHHGGIYLDTDVELLNNFDDFLNNEAFSCYEYEPLKVEAAVMGCVPKFFLFEKMLQYYEDRPFVKKNGELDMLPIPAIIREICLKEGAENSKNEQNIKGLHLYPQEYFSPYQPKLKQYVITEKTVAIHRYNHSWKGDEMSLYCQYFNKYGSKKGKILFILRHPIMALKVIKQK